MLNLKSVHHIAIICSDYHASKKFYVDILGLEVMQEIYREARDSWKLDLSLNGIYTIELFSFPNPPARTSKPEAAGLRHLAFVVNDIEQAIEHLQANGIKTEPVRLDPHTNRKFTFFSDPDELPLELYEIVE
ncbi:MAG: glyoxylase I family protein [Cyclobacteriaceae bacterium]|jgi:glyoxylase I family protein